jgi:two-component system sensor histidine kinase UhpB
MLGRLRPIGLAELGLIEAIDNLIEFWRRRHPEIAYRCDIAPEVAGCGGLIDTTVYRIVQESLSNALRHSRPSAISITVTSDSGAREEDRALQVTVADDGQGMSAEPGVGYGLLGMSERVKALGGSLAVSSGVGTGLVVTASLPQNPRQRALTTAAAVA